jgi:hypothetical protein
MKKYVMYGILVAFLMVFCFNVEAKPAAVDLIAPSVNNSYQSRIVNFQCNVSWDIEVTNASNTLSLWTNFGGTWASTSTYATAPIANGTIATFAINTASYSDGTAKLWNCVACNATTQCISEGANKTLILDNTVPSVRIISPAAGASVIGTSQTLKYVATDTNLGNCTVYVDDTAETQETAPTSGATSEHTFTVSSTKAREWYVSCNDNVYFVSNSTEQMNQFLLDAGRIIEVQSSSSGGVVQQPLSVGTGVTGAVDNFMSKIPVKVWIGIILGVLVLLVFWKDIKKVFIKKVLK